MSLRHDFDHFVMSVAKEGKVFDQKKPLQPFLYTHEGTEMGCIIFFFTSSTLTVYSKLDSLHILMWTISSPEGGIVFWEYWFNVIRQSAPVCVPQYLLKDGSQTANSIFNI